MADKKRKRTRVRKRRVTSKEGFPTIDDVIKEAGPMGLLDPRLRKDMGHIPGLEGVQPSGKARR